MHGLADSSDEAHDSDAPEDEEESEEEEEEREEGDDLIGQSGRRGAVNKHHDSESAHVLKRAKKMHAKSIDQQLDEFDDFSEKIDEVMHDKVCVCVVESNWF
jgi:hypothetical protein